LGRQTTLKQLMIYRPLAVALAVVIALVLLLLHGGAAAVVQWSRIVAEVIYICMSSMGRRILSIVFG